MGCAQDQDRAPARDVTRSKPIRTYRPRTPADFFKQEAVRFERARINMNGSIVADGHNLSLYGVMLLRRDKICTAEGARWACGQRAFLALRSLLESRPITCRFIHVTMPPKAVCSVGDIDIALFLLSRGWAELADDVTETTYVEPWPLRRARRLEFGATALDRRRMGPARSRQSIKPVQAGQRMKAGAIWLGGTPSAIKSRLSAFDKR
jgi:endonuclease YncB( thermonuclease family)